MTITDNGGSSTFPGTGCSGSAEIDVVEIPNPVPFISGSDSYCEGGSTILTAIPPSLDPYYTAFTYLWSSGETTQTVEATEGVYSVTITDNGGSSTFSGSGCSGSAEIDVVEIPNPVPFISGSDSYCEGGSTILTAIPPTSNFYVNFTYEWSNGETTQTVEATEGVYSVTITDNGGSSTFPGTGCSGSAEITVFENPNPQPSIEGVLEYCQGESTFLNVTGASGTYQWSTDETTSSIEVTEGVYTVVVTDDNQCTGSASVLVVENVNPTVFITGNNSYCEGESTIINAIFFPAPDSTDGIEYQWSNNETTQSIEVTEGTYSVTVTDQNGCTGTSEINIFEIPNPVPVIEGELEYCEGESTVLTVIPPSVEPYVAFTYLWSNGETTQTIEVAAGIYSVTITDNGGSSTFSGTGCSGSTSVTVEANTNPQPDIEGDLEYCIGENTFLTVSGDFESYLWSNDAQTSFIEVTEGTYSVAVTDENGCVGMDEVTVLENPNPQPIITGNTFICEGDVTTIFANNGYESYLWNTGQTTPFIVVQSAGTYSVTVTDENGCMGSAEITVQTTPPSSAVVIQASSLCNNTLVSAESSLNLMDLVIDGNLSGVWTDANGNTVTTFNAFGLLTGNYEFTYTIDNPTPCSDISYQSSVQVVDCTTVCAVLDGNQSVENIEICSGGELTLIDGNTIDNDIEGGKIEWVYSDSPDFEAYSSEAIVFTGSLPSNNSCQVMSYYFKARLTDIECFDQTTDAFEVAVYPNLSNSTTSISEDCRVVVNTCEGFEINFQGTTFNTTATIDLSIEDLSPAKFTITNPNAPSDCNTLQILQDFVCAPAAIGDFVWEDVNENGQQDVGENGINGVTVNLLEGSDKKIAALQSTVTVPHPSEGTNGFYEFRNINPGDYIVQFELPQGKYIYAPANIGNDAKDSDVVTPTGETAIITLQSGEVNTTTDAGMISACGEISAEATDISVCHGESAVLEVLFSNVEEEEILWSTGETGSSILTETFFNESCEPILHSYSVVLTQADNCSTIELDFTVTVYPNPTTQATVNVSEDNCSITVEACPEVVIAYQVAGGNLTLGNSYTAEEGDNLVPIEFIFTSPYSCGNARISATLNCVARASVGDFVWEDINENGLQDEGELGLENVSVNLLDENGEILQSTATDGNGFYLFEDLLPSDYQLQFGSIDDYLFTLSNQGNEALDSDVNENGLTAIFTLAAGENNRDMDAGLVRNCPNIQNIFETTSLQICHGEPIQIAIQDIEVEENEVLLFVLHENGGDVFETAIEVGTNANFVVSDLEAGSYAVSAVVGTDENGDDLPDEGGFCYDVVTQNNMVTINEAILIEDVVTVVCSNNIDNFIIAINVNGGVGGSYQLKFNDSVFTVAANEPIEFGPFAVGNPYEIVVTDAFGCSATAAGFPECTVPVELLDFSGEIQAGGNLLQWTTATEINNDFFSLYHSTDGVHFEAIAEIDGRGTSSQTQHYQFLHRNPSIVSRSPSTPRSRGRL